MASDPLLRLFIEYNLLAHGQDLGIMDDTYSSWMKACNEF